MPTLLAIHASPRQRGSTSRTLTELFIDSWRTNHGGRVTVRDLSVTPAPFVDMAWITGAYTPARTHAPDVAAAIGTSDALVAELQAADHVVIGTPMFNFSIPAALKAYIDQIVRVGVTVSAQNVGLLVGKRATTILATGGNFSPGSPVAQYDQASGYLRQVLGWIGITEVATIRADRARSGGEAEWAIAEFGAAVIAAAR